ncbi:MAG: hypothetical protein ACNYPI_05465 [Arenicellales bacterium WSBS_2016_MAG_OTU3]
MQEYKRVAGSRLKLQIIDPEPFSEKRRPRWASGYGLQGALDADISIYWSGCKLNSLEDHCWICFLHKSVGNRPWDEQTVDLSAANLKTGVV